MDKLGQLHYQSASDPTGDRVYSLILGRSSLRGFCLFMFRMYLTISKRIRSNTPSPVKRKM